MNAPAFSFAEGAALPDWPTAVSRERQRRYHAAAEIDSGDFADFVDPSILANDTILAAGFTKKKNVENLHAGQRVWQREPVRFDEPLLVKGRVDSARQTAKGTIVVTGYDFVRDDGSVPFRSENISFRPDPKAMRNKGGGGETGVGSDGYRKLFHCDLSPEKVGAYSFEFPTYAIHFVPAEAHALGLRAPIAQGLMSLTWMMGAIAVDGAFTAIRFDCSFRQPIFWDDAIDVLTDDDGKFAIANQRGEVCSFGTLLDMARI